MSEKVNPKTEKITFNIDKEKNFSDWFTEIIKTAELADIRYNVKGFLVFQPWSVLSMESIYFFLERVLQKKGHKPYWYPAVIPEKNFYLEQEHVQGFTPEVFWVTEHGAGEKLEEKLALRPTSETAFYQMFSIWIRSYNDLPFKTYQRAQVWRYETKATRPFLRAREFHWIETHCAFETEEDARAQVQEDMETTEEVLHTILGVPFIFFKRPQWDKFAGAVNTFGADTLMPDGRVLQLPSTHLLGQNFSKPFNVKFTDSEGQEKFTFLTCYGPAVGRIFAAVCAVHGDNKGLRFPWAIAPVQIVIVPIGMNKDKNVLTKAHTLKEKLQNAFYRVEVDVSEKMPGEKFYFWEMKGVPVRLELGPKEILEGKLTVFRRDTNSKTQILEKDLLSFIEKTGKEITENLKTQADQKFKDVLVSVKTKAEIEPVIVAGKIARTPFCSTNMEGNACAELIEKEIHARVRGTRIDVPQTVSGNCVVCNKPAKETVYIAREY
ncbi:MAG: proline--tRNA ligase [Candidatus Diapherotrites archaeon]|nr:proline--tRNA ligase [Candidatus Diapherotrites archaeon]